MVDDTVVVRDVALQLQRALLHARRPRVGVRARERKCVVLAALDEAARACQARTVGGGRIHVVGTGNCQCRPGWNVYAAGGGIPVNYGKRLAGLELELAARADSHDGIGRQGRGTLCRSHHAPGVPDVVDSVERGRLGEREHTLSGKLEGFGSGANQIAGPANKARCSSEHDMKKVTVQVNRRALPRSRIDTANRTVMFQP